MKLENQNTSSLTHLGRLIDGLRVGMLTTVGAQGALRSRPMTTLKMDAEPALWFLTSISSAKVNEMDQAGEVVLAYSDGRSDFVSVTGASQLVRDRAVIEELWTPLAKVWYPKGVEDADLAALKIQIHLAEYWDGPDSKLEQLFVLAKVLLTGHVDDLGENEKLGLRPDE